MASKFYPLIITAHNGTEYALCCPQRYISMKKSILNKKKRRDCVLSLVINGVDWGEKKAQCKSCGLNLLSVFPRTIAWETASQTALRNCSDEAVR